MRKGFCTRTQKFNFERSLPERTLIEGALIKNCQEKKKPVFGICRGLQVINVAQGGTLKNVGEQYGVGQFEIAPGKKGEQLEKEVGKTIQGWSEHYQAVDKLGKGLEVLLTHNGVVKAITSKDFTLIGTQFHPEEYIRAKGYKKRLLKGDRKIFLHEVVQDLRSRELPETIYKLDQSGELKITPEGKEKLLIALEKKLQKLFADTKALKLNKKFFDLFFKKVRERKAQTAPI